MGSHPHRKPLLFIALNILFLLPILLSAGCSKKVSIQTPTATGSPQLGSSSKPKAKEMAQSTKARIKGKVIAYATKKAIPRQPVYLAKVYRQGSEGVFSLDEGNSPSTLTNKHGNFSIENVDPAEYVIVVGYLAVQYHVISTAPNKPKVWTFKPGLTTDTGALAVDLKTSNQKR